MRTEGDLILSDDRIVMMHCADDVFLSCTLENLYGFINECHSNKFN